MARTWESHQKGEIMDWMRRNHGAVPCAAAVDWPKGFEDCNNFTKAPQLPRELTKMINGTLHQEEPGYLSEPGYYPNNTDRPGVFMHHLALQYTATYGADIEDAVDNEPLLQETECKLYP